MTDAVSARSAGGVVNDGRATAFLASIDVQPTTAADHGDRFLGVAQYVPWPKAYGGDTAAQALAAASRTVDGDRVMNSFHAYFVRPVDVGAEVEHEVSRVRDGRGFSIRRVVSRQAGHEVLSALASFALEQDADHDDRFTEVAPTGWTPPQQLPTAAEYLAMVGATGAAADYWSAGRSFDLRHDPSPIYLTVDGGEQVSIVWIRAASTLPTDSVTQRLALAYVCDYTILEPSLRVYGLGWTTPGLVTASLDHSMWFHREFDLNDWVMYVQEPIAVRAGRALNRGRFFTADGTHVATVAQEGVIRPHVERERQ
ncbi:acyl-CoA thioesterase [Microcella sp.]|uniref:acyl-CoA thioesterase n=1 Tax=Microcella sp. TaxID=1913979 RepID=UPI003F706777